MRISLKTYVRAYVLQYFTILNHLYIFLFILLRNQLYFLPKLMFTNLAISCKKIIKSNY